MFPSFKFPGYTHEFCLPKFFPMLKSKVDPYTEIFIENQLLLKAVKFMDP